MLVLWLYIYKVVQTLNSNMEIQLLSDVQFWRSLSVKI